MATHHCRDRYHSSRESWSDRRVFLFDNYFVGREPCRDANLESPIVRRRVRILISANSEKESSRENVATLALTQHQSAGAVHVDFDIIAWSNGSSHGVVPLHVKHRIANVIWTWTKAKSVEKRKRTSLATHRAQSADADSWTSEMREEEENDVVFINQMLSSLGNDAFIFICFTSIKTSLMQI